MPYNQNLYCINQLFPTLYKLQSNNRRVYVVYQSIKQTNYFTPVEENTSMLGNVFQVMASQQH